MGSWFLSSWVWNVLGPCLLNKQPSKSLNMCFLWKDTVTAFSCILGQLRWVYVSGPVVRVLKHSLKRHLYRKCLNMLCTVARIRRLAKSLKDSTNWSLNCKLKGPWGWPHSLLFSCVCPKKTVRLLASFYTGSF